MNISKVIRLLVFFISWNSAAFVLYRDSAVLQTSPDSTNRLAQHQFLLQDFVLWMSKTLIHVPHSWPFQTPCLFTCDQQPVCLSMWLQLTTLRRVTSFPTCPQPYLLLSKKMTCPQGHPSHLLFSTKLWHVPKVIHAKVLPY